VSFSNQSIDSWPLLFLLRSDSQDVLFLRTRFDRAGPYRAHTLDRCFRRHAELDQKPRCYRSRPSEPSAAMDQNIGAVPQDWPQLLPNGTPLLFEPFVGNWHINDWKVKPQHIPPQHLLTEAFHP
jgi:hypothetical protein